MNAATLAFGFPGGVEMVVVAVIALLIFGRRLPDVARSVGKSIVEFKKGIREVKDDINEQSNPQPSRPAQLDARPTNPSNQPPSAQTEPTASHTPSDKQDE